MKITRLKVLSKFRSLHKGFEIKFEENEPSEKAINPICFVGKNGTGKSNVIEFLCEIFYYLETLHLPFYESGKQFNLGFELEYFRIGSDGQKMRVFIKKQSNHNYPTLVYTEDNKATKDKLEYYSNYMHETTLKQLYEVLDKETMTSSPTIFPKDFVGKEAKDTLKRLLPHQIIGYSSGLNELVSNPFIRMQFNYFYDYRKGLEDGLPEIGGGSRLSFMDYDSNALVLLSNYLTQDEETKDKLKTVNDKIEVEGIDSFRLVICGDLKDETFEETDELAFVDGSIFQPYSDAINSLMKCATTFKIDVNQNNNFLFIEEPELHLTPTQGKKAKEIIRDNQYLHNNQIIFDFKVTDATKEVFKHYFGSAKKLYQFLQRLNTLNINTFTEEQIETVRKADKDFNISSYLPKKSNDELLFYVDKLQLKKTNNDKPIAYNGLSDGEHQFLHIIGTTLLMDEPDTIFFLDEPETHYNPMWRSKLVSTLNEVAGDTGSRQQMFVITTHSPFILSDCYQENVFKFKREEGQPPKAEMISTKTYGASFDVLLSEAFDIEATISKLSNEEIEKQYQKSMDTLEQIEAIKDEIRPLGESVEKILLFEYLNRKKRSLKK